jgi:hypothetical protein
MAPHRPRGGIDDVEEWCDSVKEPRVVVMDVFAKARPAGSKNKQQPTSPTTRRWAPFRRSRSSAALPWSSSIMTASMRGASGAEREVEMPGTLSEIAIGWVNEFNQNVTLATDNA